MNSFLKFRTLVVVGVVALFAVATYPLTPRDFYQTFTRHLKPGMELRAQKLITDAKIRQVAEPGVFPSVALLEAADAAGEELREITDVAPGAGDNSEAIAALRKKASSSIRLGLDLNGGVEFVLNLRPDFDQLAAGGLDRKAAEEKLRSNFNSYRDLAMEALRKRLESQNIFETEITPFSNYGLSLKAPLVSSDEKDKLQKLIQMSNKLEFRLVHPESERLLAATGGKIDPAGAPLGFEVMREVAKKGQEAKAPVYIVARHAEMTGNGIDRAFVSRNQYGVVAIALHFNAAGTRDFAEVTGKNIHRQLAIILDGKLYCAPVIQSSIAGGQAEITGKFSMEEAQSIADALTSGSFPFKIDVEAVYDTAPTLGAENVQNGINAGLIALALLGTFMIVYYHKAGVVAVIALATNVALILGAMAAFDATMTMPGIAGIILTLGMAVDANVLVFERMREETEAGKNALSVVALGFQKAYSSVIDGNLTTLVVALVLMYFGTGAVKGFAVSLSIGIVCSLFTALFMSRVIFDWMLHFKPNQRFTMLRFFARPSIDFMRQSRIAIPISLAAILLSCGICFWRGNDMLSVDFTGGTLVSYHYEKAASVSDLEAKLAANGIGGRVTYKSSAASADNRKVEILIRDGSEAKAVTAGSGSVATQLSQMLNRDFPQLKLSDGDSIAVGGMVGFEMTRNAIISVILAFVGMIIYVGVRYEFIYAVAGILALVHDVIIALGIFVLMGREMSLPVVAGLLTIVGYSINDTIVIFDRIREESRLFPNLPFQTVVNTSLNRTLSRTILTSFTTLIVVVVMFFWGGIAINDFMLVILMGIIVGSYSSIYIASPLVVAWRTGRLLSFETKLLCRKEG